MDPERPHRSTSELFICFTSRLSSSSMKIPSKSIHSSPGRTREPSQISLSSSLSSRLRRNGSMKGGQASPMFPNGKKKGCGFENPEPSSPKVTCIGQVRVKTKKHGKKFRVSRSKRRGEVSFRKVDHNNGSNSLDNMGYFLSNNSHHQQQQQQQECKKWVHLPLTICEALKAFGAEFNCFMPCRSSCMANQRDKEDKTVVGSGGNQGNGNGSSSCGAVFEEGKERGIELVVGGEDDERRKSSEILMSSSSQRRHVFEDIEINDCGDENMGDEDEEEEEARVSTCIPPKNALLLMRCRSDPVKMAALANKFWETPLPKDEEEEEVQGDAVEVEREEKQVRFEQEMEHQEVSQVSEMFVSCEATEEQEIPESEAETEAESVLIVDETKEVEESLERSLKEETINIKCQDQEQENEVYEDQQESTIKEETLTEVSFHLEKLQGDENVPQTEEEEEEGSTSTVEEGEETETTQERSELECPETMEPDPEDESKKSESQQNLLPDCLLLMMYEPKLSMEVSKETWVCSRDFIRWEPEKKKQPLVKQKDGGDEPKRRIGIDSNPASVSLQPPRSSCSFPAAPPPMVTAATTGKGTGGGGSRATVIDQKLVGGKGYQPFVLTRCMSEPMRSSAKLAPDACFWKNRKLEPASLGVGAAGVGF